MFRNRISKLRELLGERKLDGIIVTKPVNRRYMSGFSADAEEDGLLIITGEEQFIVTDFRYIDQSGLQAPDYALRLTKGGGTLLSAAGNLLKEKNLKTVGFESEHMTFGAHSELSDMLGDTARLAPCRALIEQLRLVKDGFEIEEIRRAAAIADDAFEDLLTWIRPGMTELEAAARLESSMRAKGSSKPAFATILASGIRGALPHGIASDKRIGESELVTVDFGAVVNGYHSDMTRTIAMGDPGQEAKSVYDLVLEAQVAGIEAVSAGKSGKEVDAVSRGIISAAGYGEKFGHGLGHGVGLEIHEDPRLSVRGLDALRSGMIVTVEPGIYITGWGGVRIEDLVVVAETGCAVLSKARKDLIIL